MCQEIWYEKLLTNNHILQHDSLFIDDYKDKLTEEEKQKAKENHKAYKQGGSLHSSLSLSQNSVAANFGANLFDTNRIGRLINTNSMDASFTYHHPYLASTSNFLGPLSATTETMFANQGQHPTSSGWNFASHPPSSTVQPSQDSQLRQSDPFAAYRTFFKNNDVVLRSSLPSSFSSTTSSSNSNDSTSNGINYANRSSMPQMRPMRSYAPSSRALSQSSLSQPLSFTQFQYGSFSQPSIASQDPKPSSQDVINLD